ncbi:MAG: AAA family ATPase [Acidimicrobiia bacterium]|nr:AAA family ATPase [Acidimicrobiia bacterium]
MDREQLESAIAAQEGLRGIVEDELIDATIALLRQRVDSLAGDHRRRQITVLFADVSGFTALSEKLDAEHVTDVMNAVWKRLDAVVLDNGGRIDKHIGDALMALWGADVSREDDPERALRAALRMQDALASVGRDSGLSLSMRIGVNTGPVVLGGVGSTGEFTAMGDAVNVASRLEHAAPVGGILTSHDTYRHVRGVFEVRQLDPLVVKGKSRPLRVYEVSGVKQRAFRVPSRGVDGVETATVGRDAELAELYRTFEEVASGQAARLLTIVGEAGMGKSRLLYEFDNWLELSPETVRYFKGRAVPQRRTVPLMLFRDLVASRFEIVDSDSPSVVLEKLVQGTHGVVGRQQAAVLGSWLGFELAGVAAVPSGLERDRLALAGRMFLFELIGAYLAESPVVILLEDVHWADEESLRLVGELLVAHSRQPLMVVAAARPEFLAARPEWDTTGSRSELIVLDPLSVSSVRVLLAETLQRVDDVPNILMDLVLARCDGNPFYVEEIVRMLIDDGVVETDGPDGRWTVDTDRVDAARVPATLTGLLQARLDALPYEARACLQGASVLGRIFWDRAVDALTQRPVALGPALERELVYSRYPAAFAGCEEFVFKHALLRDVAYETVLLSERPQLHTRAAVWLEEVAAGRRDEYLAEIGGHYRLAGNHAAAAEMFYDAADVALRTGSIHTARRLLDESRSAWGDAGQAPPSSALVLLSRCDSMLGDLDAAAEASSSGLDAARSSGDGRQLSEALYQASAIAEKQGDQDGCHRLLSEALPIAEALGGQPLAEVLTGLAWSYYLTGDTAKAAEVAERALAILQPNDDHTIAMDAHTVLALMANRRGDFVASLKHNETSLALARAVGDLSAECGALCDLGVFWHERGYALDRDDFFEQAASAYTESLVLAERLGLRPHAAQVLSNLGELALRRKDLVLADEYLRRAIELSFGIGTVQVCVAAIMHFGELIAMGGLREPGLQLIGFAANHPAVGEARYEVERIAERLDTAGVVEAERVREAEAGFELEAVVQEIRDGLYRPTSF